MEILAPRLLFKETFSFLFKTLVAEMKSIALYLKQISGQIKRLAITSSVASVHQATLCKLRLFNARRSS